VTIAQAGLWLVLPWYLPRAYGVLYLAALAGALRRRTGRTTLPRSQAGIVGAVVIGVAALAAVACAGHALLGRRAPAGAIELAFPLRGGTYLVANGGSNTLVNAHLQTLTAARLRAYRGQSHGVDLVRLDRLGRRARGIAPSDPAAYFAFGDPVFSPCGGKVVIATDGLADLEPPALDRTHLAGNHVILDCGGIWVLLGHLQLGSVRVRPGEWVDTGLLLGRVGNTGNTGEPHLHVHAQTPGTAAEPLGGDPIPIRFGGRYLVRSARIDTHHRS
jgi:hypothetical protein